MNTANVFLVVLLCWCGGILKLNYNLPSSSENNLEVSIIIIVSIIS